METLEFFFDIGTSDIHTWLVGGVITVVLLFVFALISRHQQRKRRANWKEAAQRLGIEARGRSGGLLGGSAEPLEGRIRGRQITVRTRREKIQTSNSSLRDIEPSMARNSLRGRRKRRRHRRNRRSEQYRVLTVIEVELSRRWRGVGLEQHRYGTAIDGADVDPFDQDYNLYGDVDPRLEQSLRDAQGRQALDGIAEAFDNFGIDNQTLTVERAGRIEETGSLVHFVQRAVDAATELDGLDVAPKRNRNDKATGKALFPEV